MCLTDIPKPKAITREAGPAMIATCTFLAQFMWILDSAHVSSTWIVYSSYLDGWARLFKAWLVLILGYSKGFIKS